jgi:hypothetical protein
MQETVKFGREEIFVWSCFTSKGIRYLCWIDGSLDAELYCQILMMTLNIMI